MSDIVLPAYFVYIVENEGEDPVRYGLTEEQYTAYVVTGQLPEDAQPFSL